MSDELVSQLVEIVKSTKDFVLAQVPDVARQIILMGRVIEVVELFFASFLIGASIFLFKYGSLQIEARAWNEVSWVPVGIFVGLGLIVGSCGVCNQFERLVKVWFAPKLYLLEYLVHLTKPRN